ncbi:hypothetical protein CY34DRAFT_802541 [Suillus luteus UH-Slu-Lm8-n1]|uniref:Uncharacterized protein n=1 Tax=Suillus luteus UH-Slu-Lm8-n1 TaxID=930992 RepID=A0A0D0A3J5_9AGAM|nr:hypothetical protein CY34DRAFT_802541 [Suillus luteus UH-Slu-Lm8-n1]
MPVPFFADIVDNAKGACIRLSASSSYATEIHLLSYNDIWALVHHQSSSELYAN